MSHDTTHQGETNSADIYCVDCAKPHHVEVRVQTNNKGQEFVEGICPRKGTPIRRLLTAASKPMLSASAA